jgi:hypothetical protein
MCILAIILIRSMGKLKLDFTYNYDFFLISIHSTLEDYFLAIHLNTIFGIQLRKCNFTLNFETKRGEFSIYDYNNEENFTYWSLISNKQVIEEKINLGNYILFDSIYNTYVLVKEKKEVDFFLKIEGDFTINDKAEILNKIKKIHGVLACAEIKPENLKEINNLIY